MSEENWLGRALRNHSEKTRKKAERMTKKSDIIDSGQELLRATQKFLTNVIDTEQGEQLRNDVAKFLYRFNSSPYTEPGTEKPDSDDEFSEIKSGGLLIEINDLYNKKYGIYKLTVGRQLADNAWQFWYVQADINAIGVHLTKLSDDGTPSLQPGRENGPTHYIADSISNCL